MSLLSLIQDACDAAALPRPDTVQSSDPTIRQLVALANEDGEWLARIHEWPGLLMKALITGNGVAIAFDLPADWGGPVSRNAFWRSQSTTNPLQGPYVGGDWIPVENSVSASIDRAYRFRGSQIEVWPVLGDGETVNVEYLSTHWAVSADGATRRNRLVLDSDYAAIPEDLIRMGVKWRWRRAKGLPYADDQREAEQRLALLASASIGRKAVTTPPPRDDLPGVITPDTIRI